MVSRVAKAPVNIPSGVDIKIEGKKVSVKGKQGELSQVIHDLVVLNHQDELLTVMPVNDSVESNSMAGTMRSLVHNMVMGVSEGFQRKLILIGVGYRAVLQGNKIDLSLGFSHPVAFVLPEGLTAEVPSATEIILKGANKQQVGQAAANIRSLRPVEPYKGKGVRYEGEEVILKEGKKK